MARRPAAYALVDKMNIDQLTQLRRHVDARIAEKRADARKRLLDSLSLEAKKHGFEIRELFGNARPKHAKTAVKYRHPTDPSLTWSGRGRPSKWLAELVAKGHKREEFAI